jgi:hypothetical protein
MSDKRPRRWAGILRLQGVDIPEHFRLISERVVLVLESASFRINRLIPE